MLFFKFTFFILLSINHYIMNDQEKKTDIKSAKCKIIFKPYFSAQVYTRFSSNCSK